MSKLTVSECAKLIDKSQPILYRAMNSGKVSYTVNK